MSFLEIDATDNIIKLAKEMDEANIHFENGDLDYGSYKDFMLKRCQLIISYCLDIRRTFIKG